MRLHQLTVTAFGPFAGTQRVDFDALSAAGLFLLHGATGAGKSSVLDAVCYALYGGVPGARQSRGRAWLRSDHAAPGTATEVMLELTAAGRRLEITRRPEQPRPKRRGSGTTMDKAVTLLREWDPKTADWQARSRSHQEVGEEIGLLLGMSREQFCQVVLLPQGDFARFLRAGAEERAALLGRLFDTRRFAALERRLGELRGSSLGQVKAADEQLLALAHRMRQALQEQGDAAGPSTFPERSAGEAGLVEEVLVWAAHTREYAVQRLAATTSALALARARHTETQRRLTELSQLAERQRTFEELTRRTEELRRAEPERERTRQRLGLARAAEQVAPALALRDLAETEHRAALQTEARARGALPPELAECSVPQLTEREQRTRQQLGELLAARRAERRTQEIGRELDRLDAEVGHGEGALADAEGWLARWPVRRGQVQRRLDAAYEAATRAEQLAVRVEQAELRHTAAARREELAHQLGSARDRLLAARETATAAQERWLDFRERRLRGVAAELARELRSGEPCAVCGSQEHPQPAQATATHISSDVEEAALAASREAEERREHLGRELSELERQLHQASAEAGDATLEELATTATRLADELAATRRTAGAAAVLKEELSQAEREQEARLAAQREIGGRLAALASAREALVIERSGLRGEIDRLRGDADSVADASSRLDALADLLSTAGQAAQRTAHTAERRKEADAQLADATWRARFETPDAAAQARLTDGEQRALQHRLDAWQGEERALATACADPELRAAAQRPPVDLATIERAGAAAEGRLREAETRHALAVSRHRALDQLSVAATADARRMAPRRAHADLVASLAGLTAGTSADNARRMRLESYVLAARLEQVAAAASDRLQRMSAGRYALVHSDERAGRGARSGLGLHVVDSWTGQERDTGTLSGGETFFASLALALGLADVVAQEAGGTRLDTLFIDEGFGSLDEQTLDEVLEVLDSLRERDRSVGIVSHVQDLRLRIPTQLEVVKRRDGSRLLHHTDG